jgi:hypothetical protein
MKVESLAGLTTAFGEWRSRKRHAREAVPADLVEKARRAARRYGPAAVARATRLDRGRLKISPGGPRGRRAAAARAPAFSRLELAAPAVAASPFAEVEMATGLKVRFFTQTDKAIELISSLFVTGGAR